jgi:hypothetical protein
MSFPGGSIKAAEVRALRPAIVAAYLPGEASQIVISDMKRPEIAGYFVRDCVNRRDMINADETSSSG